MTVEEILSAMTALVNQNISLSQRVSELQHENETLKRKEPTDGKSKTG